MERIRSFIASIPNTLHHKSEKHYHSLLHILFKSLGLYVQSEVLTAIGRIDLLLRLDTIIFIFEIKLDCTPEEALNQINMRQYALPFQTDAKVVKIGVNFSSVTRTIDKWIIDATE
eukprot:Gregarina_sp_Poly_1__10145@NODE_694_length_6726_cov_13_942184_g524_i0_p6_GENE_NODE_694_length_6726_cov_13_942184_g524_i0NODE_694_length_6726_cov_13_942184_g524_i0_p6_ORF_typecomplete_len116_score7_85PDDEXK_9/PF08011_11/2_4e18NucS/PF01939_16/0_001_NODE_694_length_6726_cov_13_942184_g524_i017072054